LNVIGARQLAQAALAVGSAAEVRALVEGL
jgi:phosphocarrier protein FPr